MIPSVSYTGTGYKPKYFTNLLELEKNPADKHGWIEIHAENYMGEGGPPHAQLRRLHESFNISCHGVGLSLGSEHHLDQQHLNRLHRLLEWLQPEAFSEHLAWSSHHNIYYNDLLPVPYSNDTLDRLCQHIALTQEFLGRQLLLENPSVYVHFAEEEMDEVTFLRRVVERTDCGLLLDINNVFVSCTNRQQDPYQYLEHFPFAAVGEIHLAGHEQDTAVGDETLLIDSHSRQIIAPVWQLFASVIPKLPLHRNFPVIVEWDNDLPPWEILHAQALEAARLIDATSIADHRTAAIG